MNVRGHRSKLSARGVSLIEAVVAMGVMAFGMLAVVGVQATLRANGDIAKQRAEAVRIAQESLEAWRAFSVIPQTATKLAYDDLIGDGPVNVAGVNATYARTRNVRATGSPVMKSLTVTVSWQDRSGQTQTVQLGSVVAGVPPELAGTLTLPPSGVPGRQPLGRSASIPIVAKDLGDGRSGYVPPQPGGGTVAWIFSNTTGLIVGVCPASGVANSSLLTAAIADNCQPTTGQVLGGYVSFASTAAQPGAAEAQTPSGVPLGLHVTLAPGPTRAGVPVDSSCFDDSPTVVALGQPGSAVTYICAIFSPGQLWAGRSRIDPLIGGWIIAANGVGNKKICRYTTLADDGNAASKNIDHPLDYTEAGSPSGASLLNQNFLVISAAHTCPTDVAAVGDFVNSNTRLHQDGSVTYNNP